MKRHLILTVVIEDGEGDSLCIACKHVFGIVNCTGLDDIGAEANFCPHCGASIVYVHHLVTGTVRGPSGGRRDHMISVCTGCAREEACGHAELHACAHRKPARWCSCDPLRKAEAERDALLRLKREREDEIRRIEAERDRYREKALDGECWRICDFGGCPNIGCDPEEKGYCDTVIKAVDGE